MKLWKNKLKAIHLLGFSAFFFHHVAFAQMPDTWYKAPQNLPKSFASHFDWEEPSKQFDKEVSDLFEAQGDSYDNLLKQSINTDSKSFNAWELSVIRCQLALTSDGVLGVLALQGTVAAELRWFRKSYIREKEANFSSVNDEAPHATFNPTMSEEEIDQILSSVADKAVIAGHISNRNLMLEGLKESVSKTNSMFGDLPDTSWFPYKLFRYRIEIIFGSSGRVLPFMKAGGDVRIRLDWDLFPANTFRQASNQTNVATSSSFNDLVRSLSEDMDLLEKHKPLGKKFRVKGFQIRIAQTAGGQVGVANAAGSLGGMLFFRKNPQASFNKMSQVPEPDENETFNLIRIETSPNDVDQTFAGPAKAFKSSKKPDAKLFSVNRRKFRRGLYKAAKIGSYFMKQADRVKSKNWELKEIRTDYQLSVAGSIGLATIGGFGELRVEYIKGS